jgi:hypothetical protein
VIAAACAGAVECVVDAGYQRILRQWRRRVAAEAPCLVTEVESEVGAVYKLNAVETRSS